MPKVSVLMSVYNGERYIAPAIESVLKSDFEDYEFIIINDGSIDSSQKIIQQYQAQSPKIKVYEKPNSGLTASLNFGLQKTKGEYIARLDVDDVCLPGRLSKQSQYLDFHADIALVGANAVLINHIGKKIGETSFGKLMPWQCMARIETMDTIFAHSSWMVRKEAMFELNGYDEFYKKAQDYDLLLRFIEKYKIACLPEYLVEQRITESSLSFEGDLIQNQYATVAQLCYLLRKSESGIKYDQERQLNLVSKVYFEMNMKTKNLAHRYLSLARYDFRAGLIVSGIKKVFKALRSDPLHVVFWKNLPMKKKKLINMCLERHYRGDF